METVHETDARSGDAGDLIARFKSGSLGIPHWMFWTGDKLALTLQLTELQQAAIANTAPAVRNAAAEYLMITLARDARGVLADFLGLPPNHLFDGDLGRFPLDMGMWFNFDGAKVTWEIPPEHLDQLAQQLRGGRQGAHA